MNLSLFFKKYPFKKVLVGLSGGPDSMALIHLLLELPIEIELGIAHIDHGWREESAEEALFIKNFSQQKGLNFFLHTINTVELKGNIEEASRNERLAFFKKISLENNYQAVVLGHHANDQAETVLKRIFEGARISALKGISERNELNGMVILRPLIKFEKEELIDYLTAKNVPYFTDPTNFDERFLRGKMRKKLLPFLQENFKKNIIKPLCRFSETAEEINNYLDLQVKNANIQIIESDLGAYADLSIFKHSLEVKWFLSHFCKAQKIPLSQDQLVKAAKMLLEKKANVSFGNNYFIDRGYFFYFLKGKPMNFKEICSQPWKLKFERFKRGDTDLLGWKSVFTGHCRVILPVDEYNMTFANTKSLPSLDLIWNQKKVPAFFRYHTPILMNGQGCLAQEFLSGEKVVKHASKSVEVTVSLYREY